jgi:hypothetical protein
VIGLQPAGKDMDEAIPIYPHLILGRNPYHNIANHVDLGITYENDGNQVPCELCRVTRTTTTTVELQLLSFDINRSNPTFTLKLGDMVRFGDDNEFVVVLIDRTHLGMSSMETQTAPSNPSVAQFPAKKESSENVAKRRRIDSPTQKQGLPMKGRPRHVAKRHEVGEESYQPTKEQTVISMGNWSLEILDERETPAYPDQFRSQHKTSWAATRVLSLNIMLTWELPSERFQENC